jgi:hypothetical protein
MITFIQNIIAKLNGRKDGKLNTPARCNDKSPYIREVIEKCRKRINRLASRWLKNDAGLKTQWLMTMNNEHAKRKKLHEAENDFETAASDYFRFHTDETSLPRNLSFNFVLYWILLIVFVFADIYFTVLSFRVFGDSDFLNFLISFVLGIVFVATVHKFGEELRNPKRNLKTIIMLSFGLALLLTVVVMLGTMRGHYVTNSPTESFSIWFFIVLALFCVFSGLFLSFSIHKPGVVILKQAEKRLNRTRLEMQKALDNRLRAVSNREKTHNYFIAVAKRNITRANELFHIYWKKNLRTRSSQPEGAFSPEPVVIEIPQELAELEWTTVDFSNNEQTNHKQSNPEYEKYSAQKNGSVNAAGSSS